MKAAPEMVAVVFVNKLMPANENNTNVIRPKPTGISSIGHSIRPRRRPERGVVIIKSRLPVHNRRIYASHLDGLWTSR